MSGQFYRREDIAYSINGPCDNKWTINNIGMDFKLLQNAVEVVIRQARSRSTANSAINIILDLESGQFDGSFKLKLFLWDCEPYELMFSILKLFYNHPTITNQGPLKMDFHVSHQGSNLKILTQPDVKRSSIFVIAAETRSW